MVRAVKEKVCPKPSGSFWRPWENAGEEDRSNLPPDAPMGNIESGSSRGGYIDSDDLKSLIIDTASEGERERRRRLSTISKSSGTPHGYIDSGDLSSLYIDTASEGETILSSWLNQKMMTR